MPLNKQQDKAVNHVDGPCLVTACPGSGKTTVLVERTANLILNKNIPSSRLLCLTFTNKAAKEMSERISAKLKDKEIDFFVGTFHSLCASILRKYGSKIGYTPSFSIFDDKDQEDCIVKIARSMGIQKKDIDTFIISKGVNDWRENLETDEQLFKRLKEDYTYSSIAKQYLSQIKEQNSIDFSGLLSETIRLFKEHPDLLAKFQEKFKYIQVDEMQDTNYAQFQIINLLGGKYKNIFLVGDCSQSIYRFRGARYKNILDFLGTHANCERIPLEKNYRSTPQICSVAEKLIANNKSHTGEKIETDNPPGSDVSCEGFITPSQEAQWVARHIDKMVADHGWSYSDFVILYRLNNQSLELQTALSYASLPFTVIGGPSFFDRREIRDCLAMLKFLINPNDVISFNRVALLFNGVGAVTVSQIDKIAVDNKLDIMSACKRIKEFSSKRIVVETCNKIVKAFDFDYSKKNAGDCLSLITNDLRYNHYLEIKCPEDHNDRKLNVQELINNATAFGQKASGVDKYLQNIALVSSSDKNSDENSVSLMTIHAAKGLEFPVVFIVGLEQNMLPHSLSLFDSENPEEGVEEERRIAYVAFTRAKKHLFVTYNKTRPYRDNRGFMSSKTMFPSQFLFEAGLLKQEDAE